MMEIAVQDYTTPKFDDDGFLTDPAQWDTELARLIASQDGIGYLSNAHWAVILRLRDHYLSTGALLPASRTCHVNQQDSKCVAGLFQNLREAWRIAGLPNPGAARSCI